MHADRTNRLALTILGLLTLLVGAFGIVASVGGFGNVYSHRTLLANTVSNYAGSHSSWFWWAVAGVCLIILILALRWILVLLVSTDRVGGDITVRGEKDRGATVVQPAALTGALTREIETYHGVDSARARVLGHPSDPEVVVTVTARQSIDLHALHQRLQSEALAHARQALGRPALPIQLDLDVNRRTAS